LRLILFAGLLPAVFLAGGMVANAQSIHFQHVNTSTGLSENNVRSIAIDKNGFLWIGTIDGLNVYDGYSVMVCKKETQPEMASNNIIHMTCDSRNRIWLGTNEGVTWLDESRSFHRVILNDSIAKFGCRTVMDTKIYGPVLYTSLGQFFFSEKKKKWEKLDWIPDWLAYRRFHDAEPFDENKIIYATDSLVAIVDYGANKIVYQQPFTAVFSLCRYSGNELAIGLQHGQVQIVDIRTKEVVKKYLITSELNKKQINATLTEVRLAVNGSLLVATEYAGLVIIDKAGNISSYIHDPSNPESIGANLTWRVLSGNNGDIIVGTMTAGVSIFNIYNKQAWYKRLFNDGKGNLYDSYVSEMTEDKNGVLWIGALERLIKWDKENNRTRFYYYDSKPIWTGAQNIEIRSVCIDKLGRVWVSALGDWLSVLDETTGQFKKILRDTSLAPNVKDNYVTHLYTALDGIIWAGTDSGFYTIEPITLKIKTLKDYPILKGVENFRVNSFLEDRSGNMWIATYNGVYRYNRTRNRVDSFFSNGGSCIKPLSYFI
jgi:ligand-binding sensor domain-containing protein